MSKPKNKIRVRFVGTNAEDVTGSCVLVETNTKKILIECGLYQGEKSLLEHYKINNSNFVFKPKEIDYLILLHSHIDHVGLVPKLYKQGATCKIIAPKGLRDFFEIMAKDSAFIMDKEAEDLRKKFKRDFEPIYTSKEVETALSYWNEYEKEQIIEIEEDLKIRFTNSGHIINACQGEFWIKNNNRVTKIAVTSDLGNVAVKNFYIEDFQPIEKANLLIGEATYAKELKHIGDKNRRKDLEKIKSIITQVCVENKGKILFPVFALQRCQTLLTCIYDLFNEEDNFNIPIIIDSPLALKLSQEFLKELKGEQKEKFEKVLQWQNLKQEKDFEGTQEWVNSKEPCVFLSCSGMMNAGRSVYIASQILPNVKNCIVFCGYAGEGTLAYKIKNNKQKTITIEGKKVPCRSQVINLLSFSNHMQRKDLLQYYSNGNYDKIAIVHSEFKSKITFCEELQKEINKKNKTNKVICVNKSTEILL